MRKLGLVLLTLAILATPVWAQDDLVSNVILAKDPSTPSAFMDVLKQAGLTLNLHTVANRGACNPSRGSFSIFGDVGQDLSFGVFVEPNDTGELTLQEDHNTRLLVEVIARDKKTGLKNFWELIGEKTEANWYYRGNSLDILADIKDINMGPSSEPVFGKRLRCSGCHTGGDLVMKELFPYNDWRTETALDTGEYKLSPKVQTLFAEVRSAHNLSELVDQSLRAYVTSLEQHSTESDAQWTRSVLAPLEMNLASDVRTFKNRQALGQPIEIPAAFFVDPLLTGAQEPIPVSVELYEQVLKDLGSSFAPDETEGLLETQHAFLVPVRSRFDTLRVESLLARGLMDGELLADLLAVDWQKNLYSDKRLELMTLLPSNWTNAKQLREALLNGAEKGQHSSVAASELLQNLQTPSRTAAYHKTTALVYLQELRESAADKQKIREWVRMASRRRQQIQDAQTSANPRGSILEGGLGSTGFRRIFPQYKKLRGALRP